MHIHMHIRLIQTAVADCSFCVYSKERLPSPAAQHTSNIHHDMHLHFTNSTSGRHKSDTLGVRVGPPAMLIHAHIHILQTAVCILLQLVCVQQGAPPISGCTTNTHLYFANITAGQHWSNTSGAIRQACGRGRRRVRSYVRTPPRPAVGEFTAAVLKDTFLFRVWKILSSTRAGPIQRQRVQSTLPTKH